MKLNAERLAAFRNSAAQLTRIDIPVYEQCGRDPLEPIIGLGDADARIGFFGRDPGRDEVRYATPFIGAGGQKVRAALYRHLYGRDLPDFAASVEVGKLFFWANTVPYKPIGNKAWSMKDKREFHRSMAELLLDCWRGSDLIVLGREAFFWFGIGGSKAIRDELLRFWSRPDRYTAVAEVKLAAGDSAREFRLYPLPHPSPLNATWYKLFPELLAARLEQLDVRLDTLRVGEEGNR